MSSSVYDARPAYHHQETSPKTIPSIKITAGIPLSAIRPSQASPSSAQQEALELAAKQGGISMPLSPTRSPQLKLQEPHEGSPSYKSPFRHTGRNGNYVVSPVQVAEQHIDTVEKKLIQPSTPLSLRTQSALSPKLAEAADPDSSVISIASLKLQDENSGTQFAHLPSERRDSDVDELTDELAEASVHDKPVVPTKTTGETMRATFGSEMDLRNTLEPFRNSIQPSASPRIGSARPSLGVVSPDLRASTNGRRAKIVDPNKYKDLVGRPDNFSIRTGDGYTLRVHKENLLVYTNLLDNVSRNAKAVDVPESAEIMDFLVAFCYPQSENSALYDTSSHKDWKFLLDAMVVAEKYGIMKTRAATDINFIAR